MGQTWDDRIFFGAVVVALAAASLVGLVTEVPTTGAPRYALDSALVYRLEVGAVFFLAFYAATVLVRLASRGLTPSRVSTTAVDLPQMINTVGAVSGELEAERTTIDDMLGAVDDHAVRISTLERLIEEHGQRPELQ